MSNTTYNVTLTLGLSFFLVDEVTLLPFNVNATNRTSVELICSNMSEVLDFRSAGAPNLTITPACPYSFVKVNVLYNDTSSYFRTLIPEYNQSNITIFLVDLATDSVVQQNLLLTDLTGEFSEGVLRIKKILSSDVPRVGRIGYIIEQYFDVSSSSILFLLKDAVYSLEMENNDGEVRSLGNLIATVANEKTITLPAIAFYPENEAFGGSVIWSYYFSVSDGLLRVAYNDSLNDTLSFVFKVYNGSNTSQLLFDSGDIAAASVVSTYNFVIANQTYVSELAVLHGDAGTITDSRLWGAIEAPSVSEPGFAADILQNFFRWVVFVFLVIVALLFTKETKAAGVATMAIFLWVFKYFGWIPVSGVTLSFVTILVAIIAAYLWFVEDREK